MLEDKIFERYTPDFSKLQKFGFKKNKTQYYLEKKFMNDEFLAKISISNRGLVKGKVFDAENNNEYLPLRIENIQGGFVNEVKEAYISILNEIRNECFGQNYFISNQANRIANRIYIEYYDEPVFMWEKFPTFGVFKNRDSDKWYAIIMYIERSKLEKNSNKEFVEIINIKLEKEKIPELLKERGFYPAWHMNKKSWITITLDDTLSDEELMEYIEESYSYSINKKRKN